MNCPHCPSLKVANRSRLTRHGYKTFKCNNCNRTFNERTGTPFNRTHIQTATLFKVVLWGLRYKLSLSDLAEMFSVEVERFYFARETIRRWREKFAPLITDELKKERKGHSDLRWKIDETLVKIGSKHHYLYRAIDSQGKLVETKLSPVRTLESTQAFLKAAVATTGQQLKQVTTDKEVTYPTAIEKILGRQVEHRTERYLNNRMEQDHQGIKARYRSMKGFKQFEKPKYSVRHSTNSGSFSTGAAGIATGEVIIGKEQTSKPSFISWLTSLAKGS